MNVYTFVKFAFLLLIASAHSPTAATQKEEVYPGKIRLALYKNDAKPLNKYKHCISFAAKMYEVHELILMSVLLTEDGYLAPLRKNANGTYDHGFGQINSIRKGEVAKIGFSMEELVVNPCKNIIATSYLLSTEISDAKELWTGIGNYHYSNLGKYPKNHFKYKKNVFKQYLSLVAIAQSN
jgi:hypothetical protein